MSFGRWTSCTNNLTTVAVTDCTSGTSIDTHPADRVIRSLDQIIEWRGKTSSISCDNATEYINVILSAWVGKRDNKLAYIHSGKPQQNVYMERYDCTVRYDWLAQYLFDSTEGVQDYATRWFWGHNHERPNMVLGGLLFSRSRP